MDRFASNHNAKLSVLTVDFGMNTGSEAVDAFTVDWSCENNDYCPPIHLVAKVLHHAQACKCNGTLVVPEWPSASCWPFFV